MRKKKVLHVDDTYNMIGISLEYRHSGVHITNENAHELLVRPIDAYHGNIDPWDHDFLGCGVREIQQIVDIIRFSVLDNSRLTTYIHYGKELFLSHGFLFMERYSEQSRKS